MPEADYLADRVGIMVKGSLKCTGTAVELKRMYGKGYKLFIECQPETVDAIDRWDR